MGLQFPLSLGRQHNHEIIAAATLIAAASAAPEASYGIGIYNPHATSGELIEVGGTTVPDTTASVKAAAADHLAAKTLYSGYGGYGYGGYGYGGYGKRSAEAWVPDNLAQVPIGGGLCTAVGALAATSGAVVPCFTPEFQAVALAHQQKGKREAEAEAWYGWRGYSGAPIAGGALVIGQNSVTPDYTPEQKGAAWGLNWGLVKREADSEADAYYGYGGAYTGYSLGGLGYGGLSYGYGKRSADSEADAYYGLGGAYTGYGYGGLGYGGLSYSYGKRSADSEADAYYDYGGYGGYGLGYTTGYGYGGYGYLGEECQRLLQGTATNEICSISKLEIKNKS